MARNFNGGTDRIAFATVEIHSTGTASTAFRFKTTQTTSTVQLAARWSATSRVGWAITTGGATSKLQLQCWSNSSLVGNSTGATTINDGNWHSVIVVISGVGGGTAALYLDGVLETSSTLSANIGNNGNPITFGDSYDAFWASPVCDLADVAHWPLIGLSTDEISAIGSKGLSAGKIRPNDLEIYAPMVRDYQCKLGTAIAASGFSGTTVSDHPRVIGSLV